VLRQSVCTDLLLLLLLFIIFFQDIYNYIPKRKHVSTAYRVAAVLSLQFVAYVMLFIIYFVLIFYFYFLIFLCTNRAFYCSLLIISTNKYIYMY